MNIPTVQDMLQKTRPDLMNWRGNCERKAEEYRRKDPPSEFWENLAELMDQKVAAINQFFLDYPDHYLPPAYAPRSLRVSQAWSPNPFRPTHQEVQRGETGPTYHRASERVPPPGFTQKWEKAEILDIPTPKMTPEQQRKRKAEELEKNMAELRRENDLVREKFQAMKRLRKELLEEEEKEKEKEEPTAPQTLKTENFAFNEKGE